MIDPELARALDPATVAAHGLRAPAPEALPEGLRSTPSAEPLYLTTVFEFESIEAADAPLDGRGGYCYSRHGLPNARSLELTVAALERAEDALATSSGMAALACALLAVCRAADGACRDGAGDPVGRRWANRVLFQADGYGGTLALLRTDFPRLGITAEPVDVHDLAAVGRALAAGAAALVAETLSNPLLRPARIASLAQACREAGALLIVDSTFATPALLRPIEHGADLVFHSASKFLGGHHDLTAGVLAGPRALVAEARGVAKRFGCVAPPMDAWLAHRGIRTLAVRMERSEASARELARRLRSCGRLGAVHHPGWGPMVSFDVGDEAAARRFVRALRLVALAPSLGGTATTISHSATSSHRPLAPEVRRALGIGDGLLRLSCGIESVDDVWRDLERGLEAR